MNNADKIDALRALYVAFGHPIRLSIILALLKKSSKSFTELKYVSGMKGSLLKYHLGVLERSGLVANWYEKSRSNHYSFYKLAPLTEKHLAALGIMKKNI